MVLTVGFTSMDQATETALRAAFVEANEQLQNHFSLVAENAAEYVVIDMDSMYGPMGWLRLHAAGKQVVGLTAAPRTQADFRLGRPFDTRMVADVLRGIAAKAGVDVTSKAIAAAPQTDTPDAAPPRPAAMPEPAPVPPAVTPRAEPPAEATATPEAPPAPGPLPTATAAPEPAPARDPVFADWLRPGALSGRRRYQREGGPVLWIDASTHAYHGPTQLKPLAPYFSGTVRDEAFEAVDEGAWAAGIATAGTPQPLSRLRWFGGLLAGGGKLLPGHDPDGRYRLAKWTQTEREYPRHFRIATAMMKGPATLAEIAEASGMPPAEVADFVNANLAAGYAELVPEPTPEPELPAKPGGFFGRLRRKP
ncbi:hypothetical protein [Luteimonas sp. R10]|uniref:hypothetical protein n=1 Tax=Luteimonas sp. R10 TaxID=3108176 RepID=UPI00308B956D|nr:hypothetical protein U3649_08675 [Luteimonas sp. R10]